MSQMLQMAQVFVSKSGSNIGCHVAQIFIDIHTPYYYQEKALGHNTENPGRLILKIDSVPADKKATFSTEEIRLMRITINRLRNERLGKGQYTDAADDMLLKLF